MFRNNTFWKGSVYATVLAVNLLLHNLAFLMMSRQLGAVTLVTGDEMASEP